MTEPMAVPSGSDSPADGGLWTFPNLISVLRICAIPVFLWLLLGKDDTRNGALLLIAIGVTDFVDGALARRFPSQSSEIGKLLDPTADRLAILAALIGGLIAGALPAWLAWPLLIRETLIGAGTLLLITKLSSTPQVRMAGKTATAIVYASIPAYYLAAAEIDWLFFSPQVWEGIGLVTGIVGLALYWVVTFQYSGDLLKKFRELRRPSD